jgi:hypothetical protein
VPVDSNTSRVTVRLPVTAGAKAVRASHTASSWAQSSASTSIFVAPCASVLEATGSSVGVSLTWTMAVPDSTYEVHRSSDGVTYALIQTTAALGTADMTAEAGKAYIYKVRSFDASGAFSPFSNPALTVVVAFTDNPIQARLQSIKALHITELRGAVNAVRTLARLAPASFSPAPQRGSVMTAVHINELRTALQPAFSALTLAQPVYADPALASGSVINAVHVQQLRDAVR